MSAAQREPSTLAGWVTATVMLALLTLAALYVADRLYDPQRFQISQIEVHGRFSRVDGAHIKAVVERSLVGNYFSLSLPAIEARIAQLPWVSGASVRRRWPATLVVDVAEVQPVARWGQHLWLTASGDLVERPSDASGAAESAGLPLLSGPEHRAEVVWQAFRRWSGLFAAHGLSLEQLQLDARGLWRLQLSLSALALAHGVADADVLGAVPATPDSTPDATLDATPDATPTPVRLMVTQDYAEARLMRFVDALDERLLAEFAAMRSIDLRYPNGFAVSWKTARPDSSRLADSPRLAEANRLAETN